MKSRIKPLTVRLLASAALMLLASAAAVAQPANDNCASAQAVTGPGTFEFDTTQATNDGFGSCGASLASPDVWFRYSPSVTGTATVTTCGLAGYNSVLVAFTGCDQLTEIACDNDYCGQQSRIVFSVAQGQDILIRVSGFFDTDVGAGQIRIDEITTPPANDTCAQATLVTDGATNFNNLAATNEGTASCGFAGNNGSGDVFFRYTAALDGNAFIDTCGSDFNTILSVFDSCGGTEIACNDFSLFCAGSQVVFPIVNGTSYIIRVAGAGLTTVGDGVLRVMGLPVIANDNCADALDVPDGTTAFTTLGATTDGTDSCGAFGSGTNDIWFRWTAPATPVLATIDTCGSSFDTVLTVLDACNGDQVACDDDSCGAQSRVSFVPTPNTAYIIRVAGFGDPGAGILNIAVGEIPPPCLERPAGSLDEGEPCGEDTNGGCESLDPSGVPQFVSIPNGGNAVFWGNAWASNTRDTDFYQVTLTESSRLTATLQAEFPVHLALVRGNCPSVVPFAEVFTENGCNGSTPTLTADVPAGTYTVFVAQARFEEGQCGFRNNYILSVETIATGACCTGVECAVTTAADCATSGGSYRGNGTGCGGAGYNFTLSQQPLLDITATGALLESASGCDDCGDIIFLDLDGFDFKFFNVPVSDLGVSSNGYLSLNGGSVSDSANTTLPTAGGPNNIICPAWDDYNPGVAGDVYVQLEGTAPNRRIIFLWSNLTEADATNSSTFQTILYEGTYAIEFRYGNQRPIIGNDVTVGVENADGTVGFAYDATTLNAGDMLTVTPSAIAGTCRCPADFNGDGDLNPDDLSDFITAFFSDPPGPGSDFNADAITNPDDLSDYINAFFGGCA